MKRRTEIVCHHVPEIQVLVHLTDAQLLIVLRSTRGRDLQKNQYRIFSKMNYPSHCERIFVVDPLALRMSVQALPHFLEECHIRLGLLVIFRIFPIDINAIQGSCVSKLDGGTSSPIHTHRVRSPRAVQWSIARIWLYVQGGLQLEGMMESKSTLQ